MAHLPGAVRIQAKTQPLCNSVAASVVISVLRKGPKRDKWQRIQTIQMGMHPSKHAAMTAVRKRYPKAYYPSLLSSPT